MPYFAVDVGDESTDRMQDSLMLLLEYLSW